MLKFFYSLCLWLLEQILTDFTSELINMERLILLILQINKKSLHKIT